MAKLTLSDLSSLGNPNTAIANINANLALIETALENTVSRDGTSPNTMTSDFDMNSNQILNLPAPVDDTDPVRLTELNTAITSFQTSNSITGVVNATQMLLAAGTAAAPVYTFTLDSDTGFFRAGGNAVGISGNGLEIGRFVYDTTYTAPILGIGTTTPGSVAVTTGYPMLDGGIDVGGKILLHAEQDSVYIYGAFASTAHFANTTSTSHGWASGLLGDGDTYGLLYTTHAFSITPPYDTQTVIGSVWTPSWIYLQNPVSSSGVNPSYTSGLGIGWSYNTAGATSFLNKTQSLGTTDFVFSNWNDVAAKDIVFIRSAGGNLETRSQNATDVPLIVKGATSQSAVLQLWRDVSSTTLASITATGNLSIANGINITIGGGTVPTGLFSDGTNISLRAHATTSKIYFQNLSGGTTFGDWDSTRLNLTNYIEINGTISIRSGSGSPNTSVTAAKGSLYLRTDGSSVSTRAYINTDGSTAWTAVTTAA